MTSELPFHVMCLSFNDGTGTRSTPLKQFPILPGRMLVSGHTSGAKASLKQLCPLPDLVFFVCVILCSLSLPFDFFIEEVRIRYVQSKSSAQALFNKIRDTVNSGVEAAEETIGKVLEILSGTYDDAKHGAEYYKDESIKTGKNYKDEVLEKGKQGADKGKEGLDYGKEKLEHAKGKTEL